MFGPVLQVHLRNLWHQRIIRVWVCEQRRNGEEDFGDCQSRAPLVLEYVQADRTIRIDVAVINLRREVHLGWLEGIIRREVDIQEKNATLVAGVWRPHDRCLPVEHVVANWSS